MGKYRSIVLAKLPSPPTLQMVREVMIQSQEFPGSTVQIPFGNSGSEAYSLSVTVVGSEGDSSCSWKLSRGDNENPHVEWSYDGNDPEKIFNYLTTRFPGWSQQSKMMTPEVQTLKKQLRTNSMARSSQRSTLEGDLANMPVTNLLQSVAMNKMTGRLEIRGDADEATVWFDEGAAIHCELPGALGDEALIELMCWGRGEFYFFPDNKIETRSVKKRMEILIMEGAIFQDLHTALSKLDFTFDSIVYRKSEALTEMDFESTLSGGMPVDFELQKQLYCALSPNIPFNELMESLHLSKTQVVPILFNLLSLDVVSIKTRMSSDFATDCALSGGALEVASVSTPTEILDWHKVKKKSEGTPLPSSADSSSMNFTSKIRKLTGLDRPVQSNKKLSLKGQSKLGFIVRNFFQPVLLVLMILLTCHYLKEFRTSEIKSHTKNSVESTKSPSQKGYRRYH